MSVQKSIVLFLTRLATAFFAIVMCFSLVAGPSLAIGMSKAKDPESPTKTEDIMKAAEDFTNPDKKPMSMKEVQARTNGGLNEIQGKVDADKMINESEPGKPDIGLTRDINKGLKKMAK